MSFISKFWGALGAGRKDADNALLDAIGLALKNLDAEKAALAADRAAIAKRLTALDAAARITVDQAKKDAESALIAAEPGAKAAVMQILADLEKNFLAQLA